MKMTPVMSKTDKQERRVAAQDKEDAGGNNRLCRTGFERDFLYVAEGARGFSGEKKNMRWDKTVGALRAITGNGTVPTKAAYISPVIRCRFPATEFLPSWNIRLNGPGQGFRVMIRAVDKTGKVSPWFFIGEGGTIDREVKPKTEFPGWGKTHIDYIALKNPAVAFQYKLEFAASGVAKASGAELHRFFVHYSGQSKRSSIGKKLVRPRRDIRVPVPYRSQLDVKVKKLRNVICCPTCVAMVLEYHGIDKPTLAICEDSYDERHGIYGIWPRASQAAFQNGRRAWISRFRGIDEMLNVLKKGQPIIASIRVGEGELRGARYPKSNGHLIVIVGYGENGRVLVNDPFSVGPGGAEIEYESDDIEKVWLDRGGVAILIESEQSK